MAELTESNLSSGDRLLIMTNELGSALAVYKLQPSYIRFLRWISWLIATMGVFILIMSFIWFIQGFQGFQFGAFFTSFLAGLLGVLGGIICLRVVVLQAQQEHVIVCERGLLRSVGSRHVEVVHWTEIQAIEKGGFNREFSITYTTYTRPWMKVLHVSSFYQDIDGLITLIKQRSEVV